MSQENVSLKQDLSVPGVLSSVNPSTIRTYENLNEIIPFGRGVDKISGEENGVKLPDVGGSGDFLGIAIRDLNRGAVAEGEKFPINSAIGVVKKGSIFVEVESAVDTDDDVYVRYVGKAQRQLITLDIDLESSNTIDLKIDGVSMTTETFNSTHDITMTAIAAQIVTDFSQIATATSSGRVITITAAVRGVEFVIADFLVAAGSNQAVGTISQTIAAVVDSLRGKFRKDVDTEVTSAKQITNARWVRDSVASADGTLIAELALDIK